MKQRLIVALMWALPATAGVGQNCSNTSVPGLVPLPDLGVGTYLGQQGGLYPGGNNTPPPGHLSAVLTEAGQVVPRDAAGAPSPQGRIGMIALGMSVTSQTFGAWQELHSDFDPNRNPAVSLINGTTGGTTSDVWANATDPVWANAIQRTFAVGLTRAQVQVAYCFMIADYTDPFPIDAQKTRDDFKNVARNLRTRFPNCRIAYLVTFPYLGYSTSGVPGRHEPYAYEDGFGAKWAIEDQINGDATVNFDPSAGPIEAPALMWGPYLWANGIVPSASGLTWQCSDFNPDGIHLSDAGRTKAGAVVNQLFTSDATSGAWYLLPAGSGSPAVALATRYGSGCPGANGKTPFIYATTEVCRQTCSEVGPSIPWLGNSTFEIELSFAAPSRQAWLALTAQEMTPGGICALPDLSSLLTLFSPQTSPQGTASVVVPIPANPGLQDYALYAQWYILDPMGGLPSGLGPLSASRPMYLRLAVK